MKKIYWVLAIFIATGLAFQTGAFAKTISGKVSQVDSRSGILTVIRMNPVTNVEEKLALSCDSRTSYSGINSLDDVRANDRVTVDADQDIISGQWVASSVDVSKF